MTAATRRGRVFYVVLLGLAWLQLAYASHQFEHAAGDFAEACAVCSNFDRLEHSVTPASHAAQPPPVHAVFQPSAVHSSHTSGCSHYSPRAPPAV